MAPERAAGLGSRRLVWVWVLSQHLLPALLGHFSSGLLSSSCSYGCSGGGNSLPGALVLQPEQFPPEQARQFRGQVWVRKGPQIWESPTIHGRAQELHVRTWELHGRAQELHGRTQVYMGEQRNYTRAQKYVGEHGKRWESIGITRKNMEYMGELRNYTQEHGNSWESMGI